MPRPAGLAEFGAVPDLRCTLCGSAVEATRHTRAGYAVGHYVLHTGDTVETTVRRGEDEAPITYRRLVLPAEVVSCPTCYAAAGTRRLWESFGDDRSSTSWRGPSRE